MSDFYDLLGVEPDADKDTIKSAYRDRLEDASQSERAKLNRAWNVLSDPVQRERYDDARDQGWLEDDEESSEVEVVDAPRRGGRNAARDTARAAARPPLDPTVQLPAGMHLAENRERGTALLIDFIVLFIVYVIALTLVLPALLKSQYPAETKRIDKINNLSSTYSDWKGFADDRKDAKSFSSSERADARKLHDQLAHDLECLQGTTTSNCSRANTLVGDRLAYTGGTRAAATAVMIGDVKTQVAWAQDRADNTKPDAAQKKAATAASKRYDNLVTKTNDKVTEIAKKFQGFALAMYACLLGIFLLYLVPLCATTGQTVGMRLRHVKVVKTDGSPVGWAGAFGRFVVPLALALLIPQLGAMIGLGIVLWFFRDRNHQGFHDKMARTLVVAAE